MAATQEEENNEKAIDRQSGWWQSTAMPQIADLLRRRCAPPPVTPREKQVLKCVPKRNLKPILASTSTSVLIGGILSHVRLDNQQNRDNSPVGIPIPIRAQQWARRTKREQGELQSRAPMGRARIGGLVRADAGTIRITLGITDQSGWMADDYEPASSGTTQKSG